MSVRDLVSAKMQVQSVEAQSLHVGMARKEEAKTQESSVPTSRTIAIFFSPGAFDENWKVQSCRKCNHFEKVQPSSTLRFHSVTFQPKDLAISSLVSDYWLVVDSLRVDDVTVFKEKVMNIERGGQGKRESLVFLEAWSA
ncbi:hypothetical protein TNCV_1481781 [Trichonephila clavipes]|nr:hypothetical protein TNCV_1481781 [Trichonephila clavipes]